MVGWKGLRLQYPPSGSCPEINTEIAMKSNRNGLVSGKQTRFIRGIRVVWEVQDGSRR